MKYLLRLPLLSLMALLLLLSSAFVPPSLNSVYRRYESKRNLTDWEAIVLGVNDVRIRTPLFSTPYFTLLERQVRQNRGEYRLVTDYARIALVYKANGRDATRIAGYDFIERIKAFPNARSSKTCQVNQG